MLHFCRCIKLHWWCHRQMLMSLKKFILRWQSNCILADIALFDNVASQLYHLMYILFGNVRICIILHYHWSLPNCLNVLEKNFLCYIAKAIWNLQIADTAICRDRLHWCHHRMICQKSAKGPNFAVAPRKIPKEEIINQIKSTDSHQNKQTISAE